MKRTFTASTLLLALMILAACAGRTPSSAARNFYRAVEKGDTDAAISLISPQVVGMIGVNKIKSGLQEQGLKMKEKGGISKIETKDETIVGEAAKLTVVLTFGNGTVETENLKLKKFEGKWTIEPEK